MDDTQFELELTGKSGNVFSFFPRYNLESERSSKGEGIYVFVNNEMKITDIQFLSDDKEIESTLHRIKDEGATYFYFKDNHDDLQSDADIDDIKTGKDYRDKID